MAVDQQKTRLVHKSIIQHLKTVLTTVGWSSPGDWVRTGYLSLNAPEPTAVGVPEPEMRGRSFELGNTNKLGTYFVDIECRAASNPQLSDLMSSIASNVSSIQIVDFNTAEPDDVGYDADAQEVARGWAGEGIHTRILDDQEHTGRVSFQLRESKPF
jgi:hypothetical protein